VGRTVCRLVKKERRKKDDSGVDEIKREEKSRQSLPGPGFLGKN